jgi:NitT/TauT family transport system permease protein
VFLLAWQIAADLAHSRLLPTVTSVLDAMVQQTISGALPWNLAITLGRVAAAFALSLLLGSGLGIAMGRSRRLDLWLDNTVTVLLNLPALVLIVLIYVWFGLNEIAAIAAVALNKLPNTVVTMREGARALDPALAEMAQSFHMSRSKVLRHVILPQLAPYLFAAARSGLALIWKIVLVVELLGRSNGVGFQIQIYFQLFDVTLILAYTLAFILVAQAIEWGMVQPLERWATRWRR